jgi:glycosyltransferase involved in cell wall biosynthesis
LRVALVYGPISTGGTPYVYNLSNALIRCGVEVEVLTPNHQKRGSVEVIKGVPHRFLDYPPFIQNLQRRNQLTYPSWLLGEFAYARSVAGVLKREDYDALHSFSEAFCFFIHGMTAKPIIYNCNDGAFGAVGLPTKHDLVFKLITTPLASRACAAASSVICGDGTIMKGMMKLAPHSSSKMVTILPGVDTSFFDPRKRQESLRRDLVPADGVLVAYVGRVTSIKNPAVVIRAMRQVKESPGKKVSLAVIGPLGDGPDVASISSYAAQMKRDTRNWGLEDSIHFMGQLSHDELARVLASCDVLVRPTPVEGIGAAVLEGLSSGLPILAADVDATRTIIRDNGVGYVFRWDDETSLASQIVHLANDPETRSQMSKRAREIAVRKYDWSSVAKQTSEVYASLGARGRG